jgi:hypothetical protein
MAAFTVSDTAERCVPSAMDESNERLRPTHPPLMGGSPEAAFAASSRPANHCIS